MFQGLTGWHLVIVLAVVLLLFGAPKLPGLARSIGQSMRIFRSEVKTMKDENGTEVVVDEVDEEPEAPVAAKKPAAKPTTTKSASSKASTTKAAPKNTTSKS